MTSTSNQIKMSAPILHLLNLQPSTFRLFHVWKKICINYENTLQWGWGGCGWVGVVQKEREPDVSNM